MEAKIRIKIETASHSKEEDDIYVDNKTRYEDLLPPYMSEFDGQPVLVRRGGQLHELSEKVIDNDENSGESEDDQIVFLDSTNKDGYRVYMRSLAFIFIRAVYALYPECQVIVSHSISGAAYCNLYKDGRELQLDTSIRDRIRDKMREMINKDLPIIRQEMPVAQAIEIFKALGRKDKVDLLSYLDGGKVAVYTLADYQDSFYGYMVPSTRYVDIFDLELFDRGLAVIGIRRDGKREVANFRPQYKLSDTYKEAEEWAKLQGIRTVADLNARVADGRIGDVVRVTEVLQQYKVMQLAREIQLKNKRVILISAPSSSGKTSFAYKLITALQVMGMRPVSISMDDYFFDREDTPRDENGDYDFESVNAIDLKLFNHDMLALLRGEEVERIRYDFPTGKRVYTGEYLNLHGYGPLIIEGIHALNPVVTAGIDETWKYRIYLSVTTMINLDAHNRLPTTDLRLMRRIARGINYRGISARETILNWPKVREGEIKNIFPYSEGADIFFNSAFVYETATLKPIIMNAFKDIGPEDPCFIEVNRIKAILRYISSMEDWSDIVNVSILREFIGGSKLV